MRTEWRGWRPTSSTARTNGSRSPGRSTAAAWTDWFDKLGDALVDGGNPVSKAKAISPDGSVMDATSAPSGYSLIKADDLDRAVELAKGCPVLAGGASVVVAETFAVM